MKFHDIAPELQSEIDWQESRGFTWGGYPDGGFHPEDGITRRQMVYFLSKLIRADAAIESTNWRELFAKIMPTCAEVQCDTGSAGTCVFINGTHALTNVHVIRNAAKVEVVHGGGRYSAMVVREHPSLDLALLAVNGGPFPFAVWGDSDSLRPGDTVVTCGNALDAGIRCAVGNVAAESEWVTYAVGTDKASLPAIDHTAAMSAGNSGGALFNVNGELVGITNAAYNGQNFNFAVPSNLAKAWLAGFTQGTTA